MELDNDGKLDMSEAMGDDLKSSLIKLDSYSKILSAIENATDKIKIIGKRELKI
jgi:hypothetical protein